MADKSPEEMLEGVVLNNVTLKLIADFISAIDASNTINKEILVYTKSTDQYFKNKDGFVNDIAEANAKDHADIGIVVSKVIEKSNKYLQLKLLGWVMLLAGTLTLVVNVFK